MAASAVDRAACIDIHGHGVPREFVQEVQRTRLAGVAVAEEAGKFTLQFPGEQPLRPVAGVMMEFASRREWLDRRSVDRQIVAPWLDIHGQQLPAADGQRWVRLLNDHMAESVGKSDGRLLAHATLYLGDPAAAARELERAHRDLGMPGCMIPTNLPAGHLDEPKFDAVWEAAEALRVPMVLHPPTVAPSSPLFDRFPKLRTLGRVIDSTITAAALIGSGVLDRFPDLRLVVVHGGGFLPYQVKRLDPPRAGALPSDDARRLLYDTTTLSSAAVRMLVEFAGADHVLVGSDYAATPAPSALGDDALAANVIDADASESDTVLMLRGNAERLFKVTS